VLLPFSEIYGYKVLYIVGGVGVAPVLGNIRLQGTLHSRWGWCCFPFSEIYSYKVLYIAVGLLLLPFSEINRYKVLYIVSGVWYCSRSRNYTVTRHFTQSVGLVLLPFSEINRYKVLYIVGGVVVVPLLGNIPLQGTLHRRRVGVAPLSRKYTVTKYLT